MSSSDLDLTSAPTIPIAQVLGLRGVEAIVTLDSSDRADCSLNKNRRALDEAC